MFLPAEHQAVVEFVLRRVVVFGGLGVVWWVGGGWLVGVEQLFIFSVFLLCANVCTVIT
jgi:hypothetical protein